MKMRARHARVFAALGPILGAMWALSSCKLPHPSSVPPPDLAPGPVGTDLAVAARFIGPEDDVPGFFRKALPDSGVVPIRVVLRNDAAAPLIIHSANGMELGPGFEGISLFVEGKKYVPLNPQQAAEAVLGITDATRYKTPGAGHIIAGILIVPLGIYYIYNEADVGRYYRPLFNKSLYPVSAGGLFNAVALAPGEEKSGYCYFNLPKIPAGTPCELRVNACVPIAVSDTVGGYDFKCSRDETPAAAEPDMGAWDTTIAPPGESSRGLAFKLAKQEPSDKSGLYVCGVPELMRDAQAPWMRVATVLSRRAVIADASHGRLLAACAVNYASKSKVFIMRREGDGITVAGEQSFSRNIRRVFAADEGIFVITADDCCYFIEHPSLDMTPRVKIGQDIDDAALADTCLFVFSGKKLALFGTAGDALLKPLERRSLRGGVRTVIGPLYNELLVLNRGSRTRGDTLAVFGIEARAEIRRGALPGKVYLASSDVSSLLVQLEDGKLLRMVQAPGTAFKVVEAGYLPFRAEGLSGAPQGFIAFGAGGACASGAVGRFKPGTAGVLEVSAMVR